MDVLVTAFEAFGSDKINPSQEALHSINPPEGINLEKLILPVEFGRAWETLNKMLLSKKFDVVIGTGLAKGRESITIERVAINVIDARIPDNAGHQPTETPVVEGGPNAYFSSLPLKRIVTRVRNAGIPCDVSNTAGTYICNQLFYLIAGHCEANQMMGGFIHVPAIPEMGTESPAMELDRIARGLELVLESLFSTDLDGDINLGKEH